MSKYKTPITKQIKKQSSSTQKKKTPQQKQYVPSEDIWTPDFQSTQKKEDMHIFEKTNATNLQPQVNQTQHEQDFLCCIKKLYPVWVFSRYVLEWRCIKLGYLKINEDIDQIIADCLSNKSEVSKIVNSAYGFLTWELPEFIEDMKPHIQKQVQQMINGYKIDYSKQNDNCPSPELILAAVQSVSYLLDPIKYGLKDIKYYNTYFGHNIEEYFGAIDQLCGIVSGELTQKFYRNTTAEYIQHLLQCYDSGQEHEFYLEVKKQFDQEQLSGDSLVATDGL